MSLISLLPCALSAAYILTSLDTGFAMTTTEERLERLEMELARQRRSNRRLLAGLVLTLCLMAGVAGWTFSRPDPPQYGRYTLAAR